MFQLRNMDSNEDQLLWQWYYRYCNYLTETYRNVPLHGFKDCYETIYNTKINNIQGFPQSPEFQETRSVQLTLKYQHHLTKQKLKVNGIDGTKVRWQCKSIHGKKISVSALSQSAWAKIKVSVDAAGPTKSIRHCKDKIKNLKDTSKQAKDNNETSR